MIILADDAASDGARLPTEEDLIAFARTRLADFELPRKIVFVKELPVTVGGKVLKYRLRAMYEGLYG
jgi:acyl-CoA synthetase (AMP-forming)/AMP-acid ligase II